MKTNASKIKLINEITTELNLHFNENDKIIKDTKEDNIATFKNLLISIDKIDNFNLPQEANNNLKRLFSIAKRVKANKLKSIRYNILTIAQIEKLSYFSNDKLTNTSKIYDEQTHKFVSCNDEQYLLNVKELIKDYSIEKIQTVKVFSKSNAKKA